MKKTTTLMTGMALLLSASLCAAVELKGTQIKGTPARDAQIVSTPVKLTSPVKVERIEGGREGLCIQSPAEPPLCGNHSELIGKTLNPGSYTVYPNIPAGKDQATVTVYLK